MVDCHSISEACSVNGCDGLVLARGLCSKHYGKLRKYGDPLLGGFHGQRIHKPCEHCGSEMSLRPAQAAKKRFCSVDCADSAQRYQRNQTCCPGCHRVFSRLKKQKDSATYCSRECAFQHKSRVALEKRAIRKIGEKHRSHITRLRVAIALSRRRTKHAKEKCCDCGEFLGKDKYVRIGSTRCFDCQKKHSARLNRAYSAKRKAIERGRLRNADNIDPIKVFERDKWRCHICSIKTPKRLRGTYDDRAPELDHIITLADGGTHTWGNVACACRKCNALKSSRSFGQLGLGIAA